MPTESHYGRRLLATGLVVSGLALAHERHRASEEYEAQASRAIPAIVEYLNDRYGVELAFHTSEYERELGFEYDTPAIVDAFEGAQIIQQELSLLPPSLVQSTGPKRIVLLDILDRNAFGRTVGFLFRPCGFIYISVGSDSFERDAQHERIIRSSTQHELQHVLDLNDDMEADNSAWNQLGVARNQESNPFVSPGFVTDYARKNPDEDQSETAEVLFRQNTSKGREAYDKIDDPIILAKIHEMKRRYREWSNGLMDEQYWDDLRGGRVNEKYWDEKENSLSK